jgi:hypothetical protein
MVSCTLGLGLSCQVETQLVAVGASVLVPLLVWVPVTAMSSRSTLSAKKTLSPWTFARRRSFFSWSAVFPHLGLGRGLGLALSRRPLHPFALLGTLEPPRWGKI